MNLMNKIPREFYKLFASKYMDYYQQFLTAIYEESGRSFSLLGLTEGECRAVMNERDVFAPQAVVAAETEEMLDSFVLKPLYTSQEIAEFRRKNQEDGRFTVTEETIQSVEDLEKLFFVWQEATEVADTDKEIMVGKGLESKDGYRFSELTVREK